MAGNHRSGRHTIKLEEHLDAGTYRQDRHGNMPDSASGEPVCPRDLDKDERLAWKKLVPEMVKRGVAKAADTPLLTQLVQLWVLYQKSILLARSDPTNRTIRMAVISYRAAFDQIASRFGLSPVDRQRLKIGPPKAKQSGVASRPRA